MRVLVAEDHQSLARSIADGLRDEGFAVDLTFTGDEAENLAKTHPYDLIVLDIMLPGVDGFTLLPNLRKNKINVPVLCLTARDAVEDRVKGLELGADDYLLKPFAFSELVARIHTIMRRGGPKASLEVVVGDLEIDFVRHRVTRAGQRMDLTPKEFLLLSLLARRTGEVLSRTLIAEQVWDMNFDSDTNVVDVHVRRLRAKVDDPFERKLIHTIRGVGYVLEERN